MATNNNEHLDQSSQRRYRTAFTREQLNKLEKEFSREIYLSRSRRYELGMELGLSESTIKVWFQNRRMKNKRQHHTAAWPFAAVYTNPAYAASLLQAAANSIGMPYCAQTLMHPQLSMIPTEASHQYEYHGYHRYMPYMPQMHRRNTAGMPSLPHPHILPMSSSPTETTFARLDSCLENDYFENSSSPSNSLSSIPDVEKMSFLQESHSIATNQIKNSSTTLQMTKLDKPKLFQPYKLAV